MTAESTAQPRWTLAQLQAIEARGHNILVAAAAGAGKTAVLTERVFRRVAAGDPPLDITQLVVVTFTDAAAAEMRQRIGQRLEEALAAGHASRHLRRQLALLGRANISTLHSFCLSLIRQNIFRLDLDPAFRLLDEQEALLLRHETLDRLLEDEYSRSSPEFHRLVDAYGGADGDAALGQAILDLYAFAYTQPWPDAWLERLAEPYRLPAGATLESTPWFSVLRSWVLRQWERAVHWLEQARQAAAGPGVPPHYGERLEATLVQWRNCGLAEASTWDQMEQAVRLLELPSFQGGRRGVQPDPVDSSQTARVQRLRNAARDAVQGVKGLFSCPQSRHLESLRSLAGPVAELARLVQAFTRLYREAKDRRAAVDFADLEHYALQLLAPGPDAGPTPLARELQARYAEILVDEYQDINALQDTILRFISRGDNLFLVGDVKQSIYRFRLADPGIFLARQSSFVPYTGEAGPQLLPPGPAAPAGDAERPARRAESVPGWRIDLQANFRSRAPVVEAVNALFGQIMTPEVGEMAYDERAALLCQAGYPAYPDAGAESAPPGEEPPVEICLLDWPPGGLAALAQGPQSRQDGAEGAEGAQAADGGTPPASEEGGENGDRPEAEGARENPAEDLADWERMEGEAALIAQKIRTLVDPRRPALCWDLRIRAYRPIRYRDIVILLRSAQARADRYLQVLQSQGIPAYADLGGGFFTAMEIRVMLAALQLIDNPRQDIPLAAVLHSPLVGLEAADLARIRLAARSAPPDRPVRDFWDAVLLCAGRADLGPLGEKLARFRQLLESWRTLARRGRVSDLVWTIYMDTAFLYYVAGLPGGAQRQANLYGLYSRAHQFDGFTRQGLQRFLEFLQRLQDNEEDLGPAPAVGENEDVVRILTVHRSKGLEFPVVFVADLGRKFNQKGQRQPILFHSRLGIGLELRDPELRVRIPTLAQKAVERTLHLEALAEEMRILYVALTRARERLFLVGSAKNLQDSLERWQREAAEATAGEPLPGSVLESASTCLDWLMPAYYRRSPASWWRLDVLQGARLLQMAVPGVSGATAAMGAADAAGVAAGAPPAQGESRGPWPQTAPTGDGHRQPLPDALQDLLPELERRWQWRYPYGALTVLPAKTSVSEIKHRFAQEEQAEIRSEDPAVDPEGGPAGLTGLRPPDVFARRPRCLAEPEGHTDAAAVAWAGPPAAALPEGTAAGQAFGEETSPGEAPPSTDPAALATRRGTAVHAVLERLDLAQAVSWGLSEIRRTIHQMVRQGWLTPEEGRLAAPWADRIMAFCRSNLGRRVAAASSAGKVWRELPFTLGLPAAQVYPDLLAQHPAAGRLPAVPLASQGPGLPPSAEEERPAPALPPELGPELVVVQGIIDLLWEEDGRFILLDFKTDRVQPGKEAETARLYAAQIACYQEAVRTIVQTAPAESYLYFLHTGAVVPMG
ncbi:MAG: UvrD-helicase domain-containing protein [Firmicutes bacterium]|nr:UvrD-helicase domain-containing protein [Bacillota bacterium]